MYKIIGLLPVIFTIGCAVAEPQLASTSVKSVAPFSQRDLQTPFPSKPTPDGGFSVQEAKQLLEFCIELNNQDDRNKEAAKEIKDSQFNANPGNWQIEYDSRNPVNKQWNMSGGDSANNPKENGIKPFNNAWLLLKNLDAPKQYAIAIRGTVGEKTSILNDALVTTIPADTGINYPRGRHLPIVFAATPYAELHLGFANAAFALLFDKEKGILKQLKEKKLPADAELFITGHSQGAAIATLVHSFLYYALTDSSDRYVLKQHLRTKDVNGIQLKSYVFAQPKPGNLQYAEDFGRIAKDFSYVINNDLDSVPQVPLSLQTPTEAIKSIVHDNTDTGNSLDSIIFKTLNFDIKVIERIKDHLAKVGADRIAKLFEDKQVALDVDYFKGVSIQEQAKAVSLNYTLAGQLIPVFGLKKGGCLYPMPMEEKDELIQHHATSYRKLVVDQIEGAKTPGCTQ
ncbi:MAG: hypothetical protein EPN17_11010 [Methylobacter sp.]|nr:MAG: hypothetical protein EPN17_11010 [Methylobacter sp.]